MAHDRSKSEMTDTARISRTELHEREDKFSVHNGRRPHARSVKMIKGSVPAYASDLELMRLAAKLSGSRPDDQTRRSQNPGRATRQVSHRRALHRPGAAG